MNRSTAAFLIALLFHLLLIALFWILGTLTPELKKPKKEEQRIKVSLKEQPKAAKESFENAQKKETPEAPPLPKGKQLDQLVEKPFVSPKEKPEPPKPINPPRPQPAEPTPPKTEPIPSKKPFIPVNEAPEPKKEPLRPKAPVTETAETNVTQNPPKEHNKLYSFLSQEVPTEQKSDDAAPVSNKRESRINQDIKELYGDEFGELSEGEQKYILDNQEIMRRITQQVLNRVGSVNIPDNMRINRHNVVEFYLYPNGDISDIRFIERSGFYILDDTTKETIEYAYSRYPRPEQKTLIRYRVGYYLRGY